MESGSVKGPVWYEGERLSDHSPVILALALNKNKLRSQLRIKPEWCRRPSYSKKLDICAKWLIGARWILAEQSAMMKDFQRDAALYATDSLFQRRSLAPLFCAHSFILNCQLRVEQRCQSILYSDEAFSTRKGPPIDGELCSQACSARSV